MSQVKGDSKTTKSKSTVNCIVIVNELHFEIL